ncbi:MAG TPA: dihydroorotate dehydrogenase-like protein [Bacteroidales bacterium]|nr:dihydroorotate dehydrogenase-like protein [Bacteroidales bacterium]HNR43076.1 dihydroorotate dehydrogenase-like protein [Bacteroidales bacterium]HPM19071.1 dihydroorotate dehydrogenase-like protein [Bacteroidales bacterium]HQG78380.1 dihydroorotate dehydrogenase-like protein [Bacteroidales bacterium]
MEKLQTKYLGLTLSSPLIVSSSLLTSTAGQLKEAEDSGAGAVVLKSLFEEQITSQVHSLSSAHEYPEAADYIANYVRSNSVDNYLDLIRKAKKNLKIPVIPSVNCYTAEGWTGFARKMEDAGADALEVNVFFLPVDRKKTSAESEKLYLDLIEKLRRSITIPISLKIGFRFSNILYMIDQFYMRGVAGVVMFNRFFEPDIDINKMEIIPASVFSKEFERRYVLRWIAMASAQDVKIDISASTGVKSGQDAVKYLLAGANTVQVCSVLYEKGISYIRTMNEQILKWMKTKEFDSVDVFRGMLNYMNYDMPAVYERTQFMKHFSTYE